MASDPHRLTIKEAREQSKTREPFSYLVTFLVVEVVLGTTLTMLFGAPLDTTQRLAFYFTVYTAAGLFAHVAGKLVEWRLS